jgi:hypothetical protein
MSIAATDMSMPCLTRTAFRHRRTGGAHAATSTWLVRNFLLVREGLVQGPLAGLDVCALQTLLIESWTTFHEFQFVPPMLRTMAFCVR